MLALLGICLPVPICAASGLTLPLPATVERIAASLVPWADAGTMSANEALRTGAGGTIFAGAGERSPVVVARSLLPTSAAPAVAGRPTIVVPGPGRADAWPESRDDPAPDVPAAAGPSGVPAAEDRTHPADRTEPQATTPPQPTEGSSFAPAPPPTASEPSEPAPTAPEPTLETVVEEVVAPVKPVVDEVLAPVAPVVEDTTKAVDDTLEPVTTVLPGLGK